MAVTRAGQAATICSKRVCPSLQPGRNKSADQGQLLANYLLYRLAVQAKTLEEKGGTKLKKPEVQGKMIIVHLKSSRGGHIDDFCSVLRLACNASRMQFFACGGMASPAPFRSVYTV